VDHKIAIARGGSFALDNLVLVSKKLNMAKGVMSDDEFMELLCLTSKWEDSGASLLRRLSVSGGIFSSNKK
jgi:5-methylcytosine-specific restriction endonuclease McrA